MPDAAPMAMERAQVAKGTKHAVTSQTDRKLLVTTSWDDGHPLDLRLAELLEKYGIAATFYIPRKNGHAVLSEKQIVELSRRFEIGAHTLDHVYLDGVSDAQACEQLSGSRRWIEDVTGRNCRIFCFPGGRYRNRQLSLVSKAGFAVARTAELLSIQPPRLEAGLFLVPTSVQAFPHRSSAYAKNALKRHKPARLLRYGVLFRSKDWTALAKHLFSQAIAERGVFHLWGHSWEIEQQSQWQKIEELLAMISERREQLRFAANGELCGCFASALETESIPSRANCATEVK